MLVAQSCHPRRDDTALHGPTAQTTDQPGTTHDMQRTRRLCHTDQPGSRNLDSSLQRGAVGLGAHLRPRALNSGTDIQTTRLSLRTRVLEVDGMRDGLSTRPGAMNHSPNLATKFVSGGARGPPEAPCAAPQCGNGAPALLVSTSTDFPI